jgi:uncharacterized membrane protein SpoIIM required for sporulation
MEPLSELIYRVVEHALISLLCLRNACYMVMQLCYTMLFEMRSKRNRKEKTKEQKAEN